MVAVDHFLLEKLVDALVLHQLLQLQEDCLRREALVAGVLRRVGDDRLQLARRSAGPALVVGIRVALPPEVLHVLLQLAPLGAGEPRGRLAAVVQLELFQRREVIDQLAELALVPLRDRLLHAGEDRPLRRHPHRMGSDVLADGLLEPVLVDLLLLLGGAQVGHPHQLDATLEGGEVAHLLEGGEVLLVGRGDQCRIEMEEEVTHPGDARLHRAEQVLVVVEGPLEEIAELDHAAVPRHQRTVRLEERQVLQGAGKGAVASIVGHLPVVRVHRHLRLDGDGAVHVAARDVEALDLHVPQDLEDVAVVGLE